MEVKLFIQGGFLMNSRVSWKDNASITLEEDFPQPGNQKIILIKDL